MKISIRVKLFLIVSSLVLLFVMLSWALNSFFLDDYYFHNKRVILEDTYKKINAMYTGDTESIALELERMESARGIHIAILNKDYRMKYFLYQADSAPDLQQRAPKRGDGGRLDMFEKLLKPKKAELEARRFLIEMGKDTRLNANSIRLLGLLNNGDYLLLDTPVAAIQESAGIANTFFLFTGAVTILAGCIIVFFMAGSFTRPILELNTITKNMATLDFSKRYPVRGKDEIGQLGTSINSLSEQLESSISELRTVNLKLMEDIEKERKIDEMRKEFVYSVSHELKTPIALIHGYAEGLKVNINKDEENKDYYCDVIMDETIKMNKIVKQLLELSYLESGAVNLDSEDFRIMDMVNTFLKKNSVILKEKGLEVGLECETDMTVHADYDKTEQVLTNYLNNAMNHVDSDKIIRINLRKHGNKARVSVFNSGSRIPEDCLEKIWLSFYKVDKARTREYGGTGLGLSIVRAIQEAQRNGYGVINLENGVEFWFELDAAEGNTVGKEGE